MRLPFFLFLLVCMVHAADPPPQQVSVDIRHDKGSFSGQLTISLDGSMNKANVAWNATIHNMSSQQYFRVTFCIRAFDASGTQITPGGEDCLVRLWGTNWQRGAPLTFKGKQNIKIGDAKTPVQAAMYTVSILKIFDHAPNLRVLEDRCPLVWSSALRVFADKKFRPTVMDKDSLTATYAYEGGRVDSGARQMLKAFTTANTALFGPNWESFRIDSASLYLREEKPGNCTAEIKMSFAGFGKPLMGQLGWYTVESNFNYEKALLDQLEAQSKKAASADLDRAISQLPNEPPTAGETTAKAELTITSEPSGAEIEIDGEYIGSTPTTVNMKDGGVIITIKKAGYQQWQRTMKLHPGDKRSVHADLAK